jgi:GT2 family glycosyltransferase
LSSYLLRNNCLLLIKQIYCPELFDSKLSYDYMTLISVILVTYNGRNIMTDTIESVLDSKYGDLELVIVENGSDDGSLEYLRKKYGRNKRVKLVVLDHNQGMVGGWMAGVKKAKGEKLLFLTNDVVLDSDCIDWMLKLAGKDSRWLVQPKVLFADGNTIDNVGGEYRLGVGRVRGRGQLDRGQYQQDRQLDFAASAVYLIDANFYHQLGGYDAWFKYYYEDVDLGLRARSHGGWIWYCHQAVAYHQGEMTVKRVARPAEVSYHVRKNMVWTVINNFTGVELVVRLMGIELFILGQLLFDTLRLNWDMVGATLRSQRAVWEKLGTASPKSGVLG